ATWKPSTSALGINARLFPWSPRYESYRVNVIVDSTATPSAPPTCCEVLIRPEAMPASSWVTPISEAIWTGTNEKPSPIPARMKPAARTVAQEPHTDTCENQTRPATSSTITAISTERTPKLDTSACETPA